MDPAVVLANADPLHTAPVSFAFYGALVLYLAAALLFFSAFTDAPKVLGRVAKALMAVAFILHAVDISLRGFAGVHPGTSVREALGFLSWLLAGGYLAWSLKYNLRILGSFVAPLAASLYALARLSPEGEALPGLGTLGRVHISLATAGVAIFALATLLAVVYLLEDRSLRRKDFDGVLYANATALETLDRLSHRLVLFGFPIFTLALTLGVVWVSQRSTSFARIEYPMAFITWFSFGTLVVGRTTRGWRGRRAAWITIIGFCAAMVVLGIYLARRAVG